MREATLYPHNPNSAESVLNKKLENVSHGWIDGQRALVLEAMQEYCDMQLRELKQENELLKKSIQTALFGTNQERADRANYSRDLP